jgi:hypothetical protein
MRTLLQNQNEQSHCNDLLKKLTAHFKIDIN